MRQAIVATLPDGQPRLVATDVADGVPVIVTPVDGPYVGTPADAVPSQPVIVGAVVVTGTLVAGAEVGIAIDAVSGLPDPEVRIRWILDGAVLVGQTGTTLRLQRTMRGRDLAVEVELTNRHGTARQTSAARRIAGEVVVVTEEAVTLTVLIGPTDAAVGDAIAVRTMRGTNIDFDAIVYAWLLDGEIVSSSASGFSTATREEGAEIVLRASGAGLPAPVLSNVLTLGPARPEPEPEIIAADGDF